MTGMPSPFAPQAIRNADQAAIGREALANPHSGHDGAAALGFDPEYARWPEQPGGRLDKRAKSVAQT